MSKSISVENYKVCDLMQELQTATMPGKVQGYQECYIDDVKRRLPEIEIALKNLKTYLEKH